MIKKIRLGDIATTITKGTTPTTVGFPFVDTGVNFVKIESISENGVFLPDRFAHITDECNRRLGRSRLEENDILFSIAGAIGRTAIVPKSILPANTNQALAIIRIPPDAINLEFVLYALQSQAVKEQSEKQKQGVAQLNLSLKNIADIQIPLVSSEKQSEIVNNLAAVDAIIVQRREQLRLIDQLVKSRFVELFGDPKINPNHYPVCQLSKYIDFLTSGSRGWARYCSDDGNEWFITIKNVKNCRISIENMQSINAPDNAEAKRTKVQEGDLLISITADLGRTGVVTKEIARHGAYINQHLTCIRLKQDALNPLYVSHFVESPAGKEQFELKNQSAVKAGLNFNAINSLHIMVPPMNVQNKFVSFVKQVDKSKYCSQKFEELCRELIKIYEQEWI